MITKERIIDVLKQCYDPEIPVNVWDLGLIYDIQADSNTSAVSIRMSLTSQFCPAAQSLPDEIKSKLIEHLKLKSVNVTVVFDPVWTPDRISEDGKKKLGLLEE